MLGLSPTQQRAAELAAQRVPPKAIARQLNVSRDAVYTALRRARRAGMDIPEFSTTRRAPSDPAHSDPSARTHVVIPERLHRLLAQAAEAGGKTPAEVVQDLLEKEFLDMSAEPTRGVA